MMAQPLLERIVSELRLTPIMACHSVREGGVSSRYTLSPRRLVDDDYADFAAKALPVLRRRRVVRRRACRAWRSGKQNGWTLLRKVIPLGPRQDVEWQVAGR